MDWLVDRALSRSSRSNDDGLAAVQLAPTRALDDGDGDSTRHNDDFSMTSGDDDYDDYADYGDEEASSAQPTAAPAKKLDVSPSSSDSESSQEEIIYEPEPTESERAAEARFEHVLAHLVKRLHAEVEQAQRALDAELEERLAKLALRQKRTELVLAEERRRELISDVEIQRTLDESRFFHQQASALIALHLSMSEQRQLRTWHRLYASWQDGLSVQQLYRAAAAAGHPIDNSTWLLIEDAHGARFGGFSTTSWDPPPFRRFDSFCGSGESFVFRLRETAPPQALVDVSLDDSLDAEHARVHLALVERGFVEADVYRWTSTQPEFFQTSSASYGLSMGGYGEEAAFSLNVDLTGGYSAHSETFNSPRLASTSEFEVRHVELWAIR